MARTKPRWLFPAVFALILVAGYLFTRLTNLTGVPIFTDEAIYIRWSQIGARDANWRFISLTDGKQPMFTWVMMVLLKLFSGADPLLAGRLTSVVAGFLTLTGIFVLARQLFRSDRVAWTAAALYVILPFTAWYDRVALYDSMVSMFSVWSLIAAVSLARVPRLDTALLLGMVMGAGMLNKTSGFLSLYFLPATLLLFDWSGRDRMRRLTVWLMYAAVAAVLSQIIYAVLRLSPFFHMIAQKDNVFVFSMREWMDQPFRFLFGNLRGMFDWLRGYLTLPIFLLITVTAFSRWPKARERMLLIVWWALPFFALAAFAKVLYPRFILFMTMPLIVLAAYALVRLWDALRRPVARSLLLLLFAVPAFVITVGFIKDPVMAAIPQSDRGQFLDDWPAGGGIREVVALLTAESRARPISVWTEGTFGLLPYAIEIYLVDSPNVTIKGIWPLPERMPEGITADARTKSTYVILNQTQVKPDGWDMALVGEYEKGNGLKDQKLRLYRVNAAAVAEVPSLPQDPDRGLLPTPSPSPTPTEPPGRLRGKKPNKP